MPDEDKIKEAIPKDGLERSERGMTSKKKPSNEDSIELKALECGYRIGVSDCFLLIEKLKKKEISLDELHNTVLNMKEKKK